MLCGDVGGTHARLALLETSGERLRLLLERTYPSGEHRGLEEIIETFLREEVPGADRGDQGGPGAVSLGVAGPVSGGVVRATNLPWLVDASALRRRLNLPVLLLNDLEALAYGLGDLSDEDLLDLNPGASPGAGSERAGILGPGNAAVIAAGTGLGEAGLCWDGTRHHPFASEGGHADFAPADDEQQELYRFLSGRFGHVSWERVASGPGLIHLYEFLLQAAGTEAPAWWIRARDEGDPAAAISEAAASGKDPAAVRALDLFSLFLGAEAGNLALKLLAVAGVFVAGGIPPKIAWKLREASFLRGFLSKGRMRPILERIPARLVLRDQTALYGAARYALERL